MGTLERNKLTSRENEILILVSEGLTHKQIAVKLSISVETVKKHVSNIYTKLGVSNKIGALRKTGQL